MSRRKILVGLLTAIAVFAGVGPAQAVPNYTIYLHDQQGVCTAIGTKSSLKVSTINTDWDPCWYVRVKARYQPPGSGGATWGAWKDDADKATWSYSSGYVVDGLHLAVY